LRVAGRTAAEKARRKELPRISRVDEPSRKSITQVDLQVGLTHGLELLWKRARGRDVPSHRRGVGDKINFVSVIAGTLDLNATSVGPNAVVAGSHSRAKRMVASQSSREMDMSNDIRILGTAELDTVAGGTSLKRPWR